MMSLWPLLLMKHIAQLLGEFELVEECAKYARFPVEYEREVIQNIIHMLAHIQ